MTTSIAVRLLTLVALSCAIAFAQTKLQGKITGRSGAEIILQTEDSPKVIVLLTDSTDVGQLQGMFKARNKKMSMAALIPGLPIQVEGAYDDKNRLVAKTIRFKGNDLEQAYAIQAGLSETKETSARPPGGPRQRGAEKAAELRLQVRTGAEKEQQEALTEQEKKIAANKAAIAANSARFGQLHDYYIIDEVTVYFGNALAKVEPKYNPQLVALAEKAKTVKGYMIEVRGYASASGSAVLNQKLSQQRASNVTNILLAGAYPAGRTCVAPGAMGESEEAAKEDKTQDTEAANRRVVVRILQNKAIAGT